MRQDRIFVHNPARLIYMSQDTSLHLRKHRHFHHLFFQQKVKLAHGTKVIEVTPDRLLDIVVPVPPKDEQEKIVKILDAFDALTADIFRGIPSEIDGRTKQYEYYRNLLLTFKEAKA